MGSIHRCDVAIAGAGLAGGLIALALRARHPGLDVRLIDAGNRVGGDHVWSFFDSDVSPVDRWIVAPIVTRRWPRYDVAFPGHARTIEASYQTILSERLDVAVRAAMPAGALMLGRKVSGASATAVVLADGDRIEARGVIDARGPGDLALLDLGWQKFLGRELALAAHHHVAHPVVMDATVAQADGFRFVYGLPFADDRIFVEDTYYSDSPELDRVALGKRIEQYAVSRGWHVQAVLREEAGVLPVVMGGDFDAYWRSGGAHVAKAGMRAGLFHPTTGYSLPDAVRIAALIVAQRDFGGNALHDATRALAAQAWRSRRFYRMLGTMLFRAAKPDARYRVLERFYRLDPGLIGRFYAGHSTMIDMMRIMIGKPPVPIGRAIAAIAGRR